MQVNSGNSSIMLVEDEAQQRESLTMMLEAEEYNVLAASSAEEALTMLQTSTPDMIISDVKLAEMDGFTFFDRVREMYSDKKIPFIFITGYNDLQAIEEVKRHGALAYVTKPYELETLMALMKENLPVLKKIPV